MKTRQPYMRAVMPATNVSNAHNYGGEKDLIGYYKLIDKTTERTIVDARLYMGRSKSASAVYCSIWVRNSDGYETSGKGTAGGYGYHKASAALASAISSAGIELFGSPYGRPVNGDTPAQTRALLKKPAHIGGCGDGSMGCALLAIAYAAGCKGAILARG